MKKHKLFYLSLFSIISTLSMFSCSPVIVESPKDKIITKPDDSIIYKISEQQNNEIAKLASKNFSLIKNIKAKSNEMKLKISLNAGYTMNIKDGKVKFEKKDVHNFDGQNEKMYFYGFIDTISNLELLNDMSETNFSKLIENNLIIQNLIPNFPVDSWYMFSLQNFHNVITSFEQFKTYMSLFQNLNESQKSEFGTEKSIEYFNELKRDMVDTITNFNGVNELFFKENFILISAMNDNEAIVDIKFDPLKNQLNLQRLDVERNKLGEINWKKNSW
ncbi:hypothetical protein EI74_0634 [Mycoplasma testudineum]|uniref:Lipoprotein n=1 Tax=Mycoplasma testudineum TaxID=244584 RepID=A0A4V6PSB7_9MOLU|nr:hypothetical protein [Mycoplasma testudineum]OYD26699.1 hypothetical protein CG473_02775 [Mycoplasma testudineum]TDO19829.1 hypothetical protein EI74_0634 [Mycoplasma testudineum]